MAELPHLLFALGLAVAVTVPAGGALLLGVLFSDRLAAVLRREWEE